MLIVLAHAPFQVKQPVGFLRRPVTEASFSIIILLLFQTSRYLEIFGSFLPTGLGIVEAPWSSPGIAQLHEYQGVVRSPVYIRTLTSYPFGRLPSSINSGLPWLDVS